MDARDAGPHEAQSQSLKQRILSPFRGYRLNGTTRYQAVISDVQPSENISDRRLALYVYLQSKGQPCSRLEQMRDTSPGRTEANHKRIGIAQRDSQMDERLLAIDKQHIESLNQLLDGTDIARVCSAY
jgi:hypothetical protein